MRRVDIKGILSDPKLRRELCVGSIVALQNREGIPTTREQAEAAYDAVQAQGTPVRRRGPRFVTGKK
jgi:hypothetical protein